MFAQSWFVTGGSGFIGSHLIRRLVADGRSVRALARSERAAAAVREAGAESVSGDLRNVEAWADAIEPGAVVVNLAAVHPPEWRPAVYQQVNVDALSALAETCRRRTARLVHISSEAAVMMGQPLVHVDESAAPALSSWSPYARTKAIGESVITDACARGLDAVILRPRFVWGPGDHSLAAVIAAIDAGKFTMIGDGSQLTSTTHVDNLNEAIVLAAERAPSGEIYFVADDGDLPFGEQAAAMAHAMGRELPARTLSFTTADRIAHAVELVWRLPVFSSPQMLTRTMAWLLGLPATVDSGKIRRDLGYTPVVGRAEGIDQLARCSQAS